MCIIINLKGTRAESRCCREMLRLDWLQVMERIVKEWKNTYHEGKTMGLKGMAVAHKRQITDCMGCWNYAEVPGKKNLEDD